MAVDPYAPPQSGASVSEGSVVNTQAVREIVFGWERLRLTYNLILLVPGLVLEAIWVMGQGMPMVVAILGAVFVGIGANLAYFLGPLAELYFRAVFRRGESIGRGRWVIFGGGLLVSAGVFGVSLLLSFY